METRLILNIENYIPLFTGVNCRAAAVSPAQRERRRKPGDPCTPGQHGLQPIFGQVWRESPAHSPEAQP
jgi:hypothetical protein